MRSAILLIIILGSVPICFVSPYYGVLMWYWVSYFNPHRFTWGFAYNFPVAFCVAVPTLVGTIFAKKSLRSLLTVESWLLVALWVWYAITYIHAQGVPFFAGHMAEADYEMNHISKIMLMTLVMIVLVTTRKRLHWVLLVSAGSLGLLAVKDTLFGIRTQGAFRVFGPPDSFLTDNNAFGLAINVSLPILFLLARHEERRWLRLALRICFVCGIVAVLLTYSRGGFVGLAVVLAALTIRSRHKLLAAASAVLLAFLVLSFAPPAWMDRMGQFLQGNLDATANQRLISWTASWNFAHDFPVMGGGFNALPDVAIYQRYQPRPLPDGLVSSGPHSIYFQLLADHGFVGLGLFLILMASCFWTLFRVRSVARKVPRAGWLVDYTLMVEIATLAFLTSGAFLGFVYLDLIYQMIGTTVVLKILLRQELEALASEEPGGENLVIALDSTVATSA
ncbi:MAG: putative O-glycosylation ligase, exosortase A system-associated [Candidatus Acidiferrales bacterium]|jgi:probable O-glycosylation ligase (exosortase A-associated)